MSVSISDSLKFNVNAKAFLTDFNPENTVLFIDENVAKLHPDFYAGFHHKLIPSGENQKRMQVVEELIQFMLELGIDRSGTVIGIGGGVVTDLTGFVGSIYLRGINFGFLPTTLLAMCDAAIGGKNGINFGGFKNMVGNINQPNFIAYYSSFLATLPAEEFNGGMAEVIKHAVIHGGALQKQLTSNSAKEIKNTPKKLEELIQLASRIKVEVVEQDEREAGLRKKLNLGHTIGHAIESTSSFSHGECIAIGMVLAAKIAVRKNAADAALVHQITELCRDYDLPTSSEIHPKVLLEKIVKDKKRRLSKIDFLLPHSFGDVRITPMEITELEDHLNFLAHE